MAINLQHIQWKLHLDEATVGDAHDWFKAFAPWIPDSPEVFVDVADYSHVVDGPVVFLSGHNVCYSLDKTNGRYGLLYERRQPAEGTNPEKLRESFRSLLEKAVKLEGEAVFPVKPKFLTGDVKFILNSRAIAPNNDETFATVKPELSALLDTVYGAGAYRLEREQDPRQRFAVHIRAESPPTTAEALARLG